MKAAKYIGNNAEPILAKVSGNEVTIFENHSAKGKKIAFSGERKAQHFFDSLSLIG